MNQGSASAAIAAIAEEVQSAIPLLQGLATGSILAVADQGKFLTLPANTVLFQEGEEGDYWYCVLDGEIRVHAKGKTGKEREIAVFRRGETLGELALLDGEPRSATATSVTVCRLFLVPKLQFMSLLSSSPTLLTVMVRRLVTKIRSDTVQLLEAEIEKEHVRTEQEAARRRAMSQMVAGVAHEINTPLGIANQAASLIGELLDSTAKGPEFDKATIDDIRNASKLMLTNIRRASRLIQTFKSLSVAQARDVLESVSLHRLAEDTIELFSLNARNKQLHITVEDRVGMGAQEWLGYPAILSQVLLNLLANVERYAYPSGNGGPVEIIFDSAESQGYFCLLVRDHGRGIDPEHMQHIFEPFFTTGRQQGGTGLGLAIVKNLVSESLGGKIDIESTMGLGTTVTVTLPRAIEVASNVID